MNVNGCLSSVSQVIGIFGSRALIQDTVRAFEINFAHHQNVIL